MEGRQASRNHAVVKMSLRVLLRVLACFASYKNFGSEGQLQMVPTAEAAISAVGREELLEI